MASFGLLALAMAAAPAQEVTDIDRFQLFNNCDPMALVVESLHDDAADIGLTDERLQFAAESRLRGARLYTSDRSRAYLYVNVTVAGKAFSTSLKYAKKMRDLATGNAHPQEIRSTGPEGAGRTRA